MLRYATILPSIPINYCTESTTIVEPTLRADKLCSKDSDLLILPDWAQDVPCGIKPILCCWVMILGWLPVRLWWWRIQMNGVWRCLSHTIYPWLINSKAAVIFLVTRNSCANLSCLAFVSFAVGGGLIGWHGLGLVGACLVLRIAAFSIGAGAARAAKGATSAAIRIVARIFSFWDWCQRITRNFWTLHK